jgi:peptidoglycan/LPS O-acetylase OafA/YrhL
LLSGLSVLGFAIWYWQPFAFDWPRIGAHFLFLVPWQETEWFNAIYWTLALEFQYYIVIALMFPLLVKTRWTAWLSIAAFMASGMLLPERRLVFLFAPVFAAGMSVFLAKEKKFFPWEAALVIALAAVQAYYCISPATAITMVLTALAVGLWSWESKATNWMGEISYSLYLTHGYSGGQILYFFSEYFHTFGERMFLLFLAVLASLVFAYFFWRVIEVPSMEWSKLVKYKKEASSKTVNSLS